MDLDFFTVIIFLSSPSTVYEKEGNGVCVDRILVMC